MLSLTFLSADLPHGRIEVHGLSDQTMMELLVDGFSADSKKAFLNCDGTYINFENTSACTWSEDRIKRVYIDIGILYLPRPSGTVSLEFIPRQVEDFCLRFCNMEGSLPSRSLPDTLEELNLGSNQLSGSVIFADMPMGIKVIEIYENNFSGSLDLTSLPPSIVTLDVGSNSFSGSISLDKLPQTIEVLRIDRNKLSGSFCLLRIPPKLRLVNAFQNSFEKQAVVHSVASARVSFRDSGVREVLTEAGMRFSVTD